MEPWRTDGRLPTRSRSARVPREPVTDPTLGIEVPRGAAVTARHRLVTIGDSLTHGFMSAAVHRTDLSWPAIAAYELGLTAEQFRFPTYEWPTGPGGLPLDLERLARVVREAVRRAPGLLGDRQRRTVAACPTWTGSRTTGSAATARGLRAAGRRSTTWRVYGWDLLDPQLLTATKVASRLARPTKDDPVAAGGAPPGPRRLAGPAARPQGQPRPHGPRRRGRHERSRPGRRDLVVILGSNNALGAVVSPRARLDARGVRRPPARGSAGRPRRAATCGAPARSLPTGPCSRRSCAGSPPSTSSSRRSRRSPSRRSPAAPSRRSGRSRGTSPTTPGRGSPTTTSTPSATRTSPATRPGRSTPPSTPTTRR